jgi:hypothetical protein
MGAEQRLRRANVAPNSTPSCKETLISKEILRLITVNAAAINPAGSVRRALLIFEACSMRAEVPLSVQLTWRSRLMFVINAERATLDQAHPSNTGPQIK